MNSTKIALTRGKNQLTLYVTERGSSQTADILPQTATMLTEHCTSYISEMTILIPIAKTYELNKMAHVSSLTLCYRRHGRMIARSYKCKLPSLI